MAGFLEMLTLTASGNLSDFSGAMATGTTTMATNETTKDDTFGMTPYWSLPVTIILSITMVIIMTVAIFGNVMVIMVIAKHRGMRTRTNMFLCNLAIADLLTAVILMPFSLITVIKGRWIFGQTFCQFNGFTMPLFFVASIHTLMYISLHKYITINRPFTRCMTRRRILLMIGAAWFWASLSGYVTVHGLNSVLYKPYTTQCGPSYPRDLRTYLHPVYISLTCYLTPFFIMMFCYVRIFREMQQHSLRMEANSSLEKDLLFRQQRRITITLCVVLLVFVISWTPYILYSFYVSGIKDKTKVLRNFNAISYWFGYMNSACNPVIYALRSKAFRDGYKDLWFCGTLTSVSEDGGVDTLYAKLIHKLFPTEPYGHHTTFQRLHYFVQNSLRLRTTLLGTTSSGTPMSDSVPGSRKVSATSITNYLVRPLTRRVSTNSLPESFRFGTGNLPRFSTSGYNSPTKNVLETRPGMKSVYYPDTYGISGNGKTMEQHVDKNPEEPSNANGKCGSKVHHAVKHATIKDPLSESSLEVGNNAVYRNGADGFNYEDDNVFVVVADMEPHGAPPHSPNTPLIQITAPELDSDQNSSKAEVKTRFLSSKRQSMTEAKSESSDDDSEKGMSRATSETCVKEGISYGFFRSILDSFQRKNRKKRSGSAVSTSSERKSSYREESSGISHGTVGQEPGEPQRKKLSLTVPRWRFYRRSHSEDVRGRSQSDVAMGHMDQDIHKAVSDTIVENKGHYEKCKEGGRRWWKKRKRKEKLNLYEQSFSQTDHEESVISITQTEEELARLQRTWSEKPRMVSYGSVEELDTHHNRRSKSFTPSQKKRKKKKKTTKSSRNNESPSENVLSAEEEKSIKIELEMAPVFCKLPAQNQEPQNEFHSLRRTWSDPTITFKMVEGKVSARKRTRKWYRQKTLKRRVSKEGDKTDLPDKMNADPVSYVQVGNDEECWDKGQSIKDKGFPQGLKHGRVKSKVSQSTSALDQVQSPKDPNPKKLNKSLSDIN